jgi:integrase
MASISARRRADGTLSWRVQFRLTPGAKPTSETFDTEADAKRFSALVDRVGGQAARDIRSARSARQAETPTLTTFTEQYIAGLTGVTDGTRGDYRGTARRTFLQRLGNLPLDAIDKGSVERWIAWQEQQPSYRSTPERPLNVSAKTVESARSLLAQILQAAVNTGQLPANPVKGVRATKGTRQQMTFLTPAEFATLMVHVPDHYRALVAFLYGTGMRWSEATALLWGDLDLERTPATARVWQAWKHTTDGTRQLGTTKTTRSQRTVSLPRAVVDVLPTRRAGHELVFVTGGQRPGRPVTHSSFYRDVWTPLVRAVNDPDKAATHGHQPLGKRPRIHDLRHSHASALINAGTPLPIIQRRLGHESIKTTVDTYGHLAPDALQIGADAADAALVTAFPQIEPPAPPAPDDNNGEGDEEDGDAA